MYPGTHAATAPDRPAVIMAGSDRTVTYADLEDNSAHLASALHQLGLRTGDVVAVLSDNAPEAFEIYWAAIRSGLYVTFVNWHLSADEAAYIVRDSGAQVIIASAGVAELGSQVAALVPEVEKRFAFGGVVDGYASYAELLQQAGPRLTDQPRGSEMLYSSGTTGRPKGIKRELTHLPPAEVPGMMSGLVGFWLEPGAVYISPAPLYHTAPSVWSMTIQAAGMTTVVMEKFDAEGCLDAIQRHRVTHGQFVPVMFTRMLKLPESVRDNYDLSSLKRVMHAAAPCPVEIKKQMMDWWGPIIDEYYASSEAIGSTLITADDWLAHPGSVGKPMMGALHILDEDGNELPPNQAGEIYFEGGFDFEYLNDAEKTAKARDEHGWKTVGDIGYLDEEGYLYLTDRRHHMIISGGVNIYPQEAENMLVTHPKVMDAAVFGIPDDEMGQSVKGVVQTVDPADATDEFGEELLGWLRDRLTHYKCPRSISFEAQLPRTDTGKLYKQELINKYS
jgi:long-chain acyl-CoA synthetase